MNKTVTANTLRRIVRTQNLSVQEEGKIKALFAHKHGSLAIRSVKVAVDCDGLHVVGVFEDERTGRRCGEFLREIEVLRGKVNIVHVNIKLSKAVQGHGWGRKWFRECEHRYRGSGVSCIRMVAGGDIGGYVWAGEGFELDGSQPLFWFQIKQRLSTLPSSEPDNVNEDDCLRWRSEITSGKINRVQQIPGLGRDKSWTYSNRDRSYWPGKIILLGMQWNGIKSLA